ncbi:hypothetical protein [Nocardioides panzhihuensis]|uniref:Uncharacterized protein n=1 Tax=Nocardioides panzhihuensis TaxID=860243 RepID=A0A7Z0DMK9_9ACTN|nr:hypothetical protein [Nocardioides panzhihuensis]NYI78430.1 hypothetical protein [Nocardioides panzhihuensis]
MTEKMIEGQVAALLNKRELALTVGEADGVTPGMRFVVLNSKGVGIRHPETNELLGDVPVPKTIVKVTRVQGAHLSIARTFRTIPGKPGLADVLMRTNTSFAGTPDRVETLAIDPSKADLVEIDDEDSYVKRGDPVIQTTGDEYDQYA